MKKSDQGVLGDINDIEDYGNTKKTADLTHPVILDPEILRKRIKFVRQRGAINGLEDPKITEYARALVVYTSDDVRKTSGAPILYESRKDFDERNKVLRKRLKCQPRKGDLSQYYQYLVLAGQVKKNPSLEVYLRFKSARSHSGVLPVTTFTSPGNFSCPEVKSLIPPPPSLLWLLRYSVKKLLNFFTRTVIFVLMNEDRMGSESNPEATCPLNLVVSVPIRMILIHFCSFSIAVILCKRLDISLTKSRFLF